MRTLLLPLTALLTIGSTPAPRADESVFPAIQAVDLRMAGIAYRLATANVALCDARAPVTGVALHALAQYGADLRDAARAAFGFEAPVAVEVVAAGSPAARAGLATGDSLLAVNGIALASSHHAGAADRDAALALIDAQPADAPLRLSVIRGGQRREVAVPASPGCRSAFEVLLGPSMEASADGRIVQIGARYFDRYTDDQIAVVAAHELAHNILRHADRLEAAGVKRGLMAEIGRNARLFRRTESEADLLGLILLRNAGYDPQGAVRFWREHGGDVDGGLFRARTHPSSKARAAALQAAIAAIPADAPTPYIPPLLATRAAPLD